MMRNLYRTIPRLYLQWASSADEGMTLELCEAGESGELVEGGLYPAATIVADDDEKLWLELYPLGELIRIPLAEVEKAIALAKEGVHGEKFYDSHDSNEVDT